MLWFRLTGVFGEPLLELRQEGLAVFLRLGLTNAVDGLQIREARSQLRDHLRELFVGEQGVGRHPFALGQRLAQAAQPGEVGEVRLVEHLLVVDAARARRVPFLRAILVADAKAPIAVGAVQR